MSGAARFLPVLTLGVVFATGPAGGAELSGPRATGVPGTRASADGGRVDADLTFGSTFAGAVATAGTVRQLPNYVGQLYDLTALPVAVTPDTVNEGDSAQATAGPAPLDDGTTLAVLPARVRWVAVGVPATVGADGTVFTDPVDGDASGQIVAFYLNATGQASFTVLDTGGPNDRFPNWQVAEFGSTGLPEAAAGADPDGDGLTNLVEFALGTDPQSSNLGGPAGALRPTSDVVPAGPPGTWFLRFSFRQIRPLAGSAPGSGDPGIDWSIRGLRYRLEVSDDLVNWTTGAAAATRVAGPSDNGDGTDTVTLQLNQSIATGERRFARMRVDLVAE